MAALYTADNTVFASFSFFAALLIAKMLIMSFLTGFQRLKKKVFSNPEDIALRPGGKIKIDDDIERVRRAHLNDIENIVPFLVLGLLYIGTGPAAVWAKLLFFTFTVARYVHTFVYAIYIFKQPARAIAFGVGMLVNVYMVFAILLYYQDAL